MASLNFFRNPGFQEPSFFDEGPKVTVKVLSGSGTGSIDTSKIDAFRQGVELTQQKYFDAGMAKIHAGEPGHVLRKNTFGMDKNFFPNPQYQDLDLFDPVRFIQIQADYSYLTDNLFTFPIITGDSNQLESFNINGVIEPLAIRAPAAFSSTDMPHESHAIRGMIVGGNSDQSLASSQVVSIDYFRVSSNIAYLDNVDMLGSMGVSTGYFKFEKLYNKPFEDARYPRNVDLLSRGSSMDGALSIMSGSTENYISFKQRAQTAGWDYDTTVTTGTDSIAFGGMTF